MKRRCFLMSLSGAVIWSRAALAQQTGNKVSRIGMLVPYPERDAEGKARVAAFKEKLQDLGWIEGRNLQLDVRWAGPDIERLRSAAEELVSLQPDLIVCNGTAALVALARDTSSIPIIFVVVSDPAGLGLVTNFAHPGGNITGFTNAEFSIGEKWVQTIKEIAPNVTRVGVLFNPAMSPYASLYMRPIEVASSSLAIEISTLSVGDTAELERAIRALATAPNVALIVMADSFMMANRERIVALAAELRLPAIYPYRYFVTAGGLICYGLPTIELFPQAASYADRILKGVKPGDLPIQQPNSYDMVVNLKTARTLGLTVPLSLLARANEVIE